MLIDEAIRKYTHGLIREYRVDPYMTVECHPKTGRELELPSNEYVLIRGPEIMLTCRVGKYFGQAFTVAPRSFRGRLLDVLRLDLEKMYNRGLFYAVLNALYRSIGLIDKSMHCRGDEPIKCGLELTYMLLKKYGTGVRVLHIGYQPGHVEALASVFRDNLLVTDLRNDTVWRIKYGRLVYDGLFDQQYITYSDIVLLTASSVINNTFWKILVHSKILGKETIVYGVSAASLVYFINKVLPYRISVFCPYAR